MRLPTSLLSLTLELPNEPLDTLQKCSEALRTHLQRQAERRGGVWLDEPVAQAVFSLIARRIIKEQFTYRSQPVENIFAHYQAILLKRYGLYYCTNCFISSSSFLPPRGNIYSQEELPASLAMTALLFFRQAPQPELAPAISAVIEQAVGTAENRGLLLPAANPGQPPMTQAAPPQGSPPPLNELIPRRRQESALMLSSNPFAGSVIIADKQARRLYAAIDDHTNVANLCNSLGMDIKQVYIALQTLLTQKRIELYEPGGRIVDASLFLDYR